MCGNFHSQSHQSVNIPSLQINVYPKNHALSSEVAFFRLSIPFYTMKLTLLVSLGLSLLQWPLLVVAESLLSTAPDIDQTISHEGYANILETVVAAASIATDRSLQTTSSCKTLTQWNNTIVFELRYDSSKCLTGLVDNAIISARDPLLTVQNKEVSDFIKQVEVAFTTTYNWMQGQNTKTQDYCQHCDAYARFLKAASVQQLSKRSNSPTLAIEMKITTTCRGCNGLTKRIPTFDIPSTAMESKSPIPSTTNCACLGGVGQNLTRAPREAEFSVQYQQVVQSLQNSCIRSAQQCSYGTPFTVDMLITAEVDGISMNETQQNQAVEAFIRASNTAYEATTYNCQPEFRRLERTRNRDFTYQTRHLDAEDTSTGTSYDGLGRDLQQRRRVTLTLKIDGTCNYCSHMKHIGDRADTPRIVSPSSGKSRHLQQQAYNMSNCFCPLGSTVASDTASRATLMRLFQEELTSINSPIQNVIYMEDITQKPGSGRRLSLVEDSTSRGRTRRAQVASSPSPTKRELSASTYNPPSKCPMVKLDFTNFTNPMARYYGQSATLQGGDYLYDQLWSSHGVRVSAHATDYFGHSDIWIPKFDRGLGWVNSIQDQDLSDYRTGGAIRLFDTGRPNYDPNPLFNQPLCPGPPSRPHCFDEIGDLEELNDDDLYFNRHRAASWINYGGLNEILGSPNTRCPIPGPGKHCF